MSFLHVYMFVGLWFWGIHRTKWVDPSDPFLAHVITNLAFLWFWPVLLLTYGDDKKS